MSKYDALLTNLKSQLAGVSNVLIVLPSQINVDKLAGGLALMLSLEQTGKQVSLVSEGTVLVAHSNLYGIGKVKNALPQLAGGNFTLTLEGVVAPDGTVPSLEKLDWFPEGANLNLVFHVLPGQKFEPIKIVPKVQSSNANLIFVIGASTLNELGNIYLSNQQVFSQAQIVNLDNSTTNTNFAQTNVVDPAASSVSEIVAQVMYGLGLFTDADIASNILMGIYSATSNLTVNSSADTFMTVGQAMQSGGKIPATQVAPTEANLNFAKAIMSQPQPQPTPAPENFSFNPSISSQPTASPVAENPEDNQSPAPDWLTPKVYKGTQLG